MARGSFAVTIYLLCLLVLFGSYCQMAPAIAGAAKGWDPGNGISYKLTTTLLFKEAGPTKPGGDVGFQLTGQLDVIPIWKDPYNMDMVLLQLKLVQPQLLIKSRKAPEPEGFVEHSSRLQDTTNKPFYAFWKNGEIRNMYLDPTDNISILNIKRGLMSLFQYKTLDGDFQETDASGICNVTYTSSGMKSIHKEKKFCKHDKLPKTITHPNPIFGVKLNSNCYSTYELNQDLLPMSIEDYEKHEMILTSRPEVGTTVESIRVLHHLPQTFKLKTLDENSMENIIKLLQSLRYQQLPIGLQTELYMCPETGCPTLDRTLEENREALENSALGSIRSASAFLKLISLVRDASAEELVKILKSPKYRTVRPQLYDVLGSASTPMAHQAAMKMLRQDDHGDDTERYLWALSLSPSPFADIAKDILTRSEETMQNDKVSETMALTAAAIARQHGSSAVIERARVSLELGLDSCTGEECKLKFLKALKNLRSKAAIPTLLNYALKGSKALSIVAWRALASLPKQHLTKEIKTAALRTFYQIGSQRKDSTVRTLAADIILENNPSINDLREFLLYLAGRDYMYEVKKYLAQRMEQLAKKDPVLAQKLREALTAEAKAVQNYNVLAQKGLSTAFTRSFLNSVGSNGSLVTVQEVSSGLLKRGIVDVVLESGVHEQEVFSLGLFAGGLGSFVSSDQKENDVPGEDEVATAGMEISLLGVGVRPFIFFSGQGELMSHVWSGTASERTPAFQTIAHLHRHKEYVPLSSGFVAEIEVNGAVSFDLAGQIQLSLWSRNAESLVDMSAGIAIQGGTRVRTNFVQSNAEFLMTMEPKLELSTNVDFSGPVSLCMRLTQPEGVIKHHIYKIERIPGSRHKLRKTRRSRSLSPAKSYLLNRKNNEMCSKVFS